MESVLARLSKLTPVTYKWRNEEFPNKGFGSATQTGLIAQDVEHLFPELVSLDKDGYRQVAFQYLSFYLLQGIKEQQSQIDAQADILSQHNLSLSKSLSGIDSTQSAVDSQVQLASTQISTLEEQESLQSSTLESLQKTQKAQSVIIADIQNQIEQAAPFVNVAQTRLTDMQTQVDTLMDFYSQFQLGSLVSKDANGDLDLFSGNLRANKVTVEALAINTTSTDAPTIGTATLYPGAEDKDDDGKDDFTKKSMDDKDVKDRDGKSLTVKTDGIDADAEVFITFKGDLDGRSYFVDTEKVKDGFTVNLSKATEKPVRFSWWIVKHE